jgi:AbrB family looped-hinge helix DNA binding protein
MISLMQSTKPLKSRVAERGQVVIPKPLRDRLGVRPGTLLEFTEERGRLIAVKANQPSPTQRVWGCLGKNFDTDAFISQIRGKG